MSLSAAPSRPDLFTDNRGPFKRVVTLTITNMSAGQSNPVPHGLPNIPRRVWFTGIASGANVADCSLDSATAAAGFDATYIYVFTPAGVTSVLAHVEY